MDLNKENASVRLEGYFTKAERDETIQVKSTLEGQKIAELQEYKYICNGAIYSG